MAVPISRSTRQPVLKGVMAPEPDYLMDLVVFFEGHPVEGDMPLDDVIGDGTSLAPTYWGSGHVFNPRGYRLLNIEGSYAKAALADATSAAHTLKRDGTLSRIYIFGASAGGRMALKYAESLTALGFTIRFLAVTDAAFFSDMTARPSSLFDRTIPSFKVGNIRSDVKLNYFHALGNHIRPARHGYQWWSHMKFDEIHGRIPGFTDIDLSPTIRRVGTNFEDQRNHERCNTAALVQIRKLIMSNMEKP